MTMIDVGGSYSAEADKRDGTGLLDIYRKALIDGGAVCLYTPDTECGGFFLFIRSPDVSWYDTIADDLAEVHNIAARWDVPPVLCFEVENAWWL